MSVTAPPHTATPTWSRAGSLADLRREGHLLTKVGHHPVAVFWADGEALAVEDRCPHMGFPLHRGTVESGLVTCHWHHARFDLRSGCTFDPWADDAVGFDVRVDGDDVLVAPRPVADPLGRLRSRLTEGLEDGLTLVVAKAVLGLLDRGADPADIVRAGIEFGVRHRAEGWGAGLTVLVAMANVLPHLAPADRSLALVHGLTFVANDTRGHPPRFDRRPLDGPPPPAEHLREWYRRFVDTRSVDAAERALATAIVRGDRAEVERMMTAAVTDHVFIDGGHTLDFTNKAFEAVDLLGDEIAVEVLPSLVRQTAFASRSEESSEWRHPHDLAALAATAAQDLAAIDPATMGTRPLAEPDGVAELGVQLVADDGPQPVVDAIVGALRRGVPAEQVARALAFAAALRIVRFHTRNEHSDWDTVHHSLSAANALHQASTRQLSPELLRGLVHAALKVHLDRFLNVPAARHPHDRRGDLDALAGCFDVQGAVDDAGGHAYGWIRSGGDPGRLVAVLGHALLEEDAGFHWYQLFEASVRQALAWPDGSEPQALVLAAFARFLAAHTPTRREQTTTFRIAERLRRGEALFEDDGRER